MRLETVEERQLRHLERRSFDRNSEHQHAHCWQVSIGCLRYCLQRGAVRRSWESEIVDGTGALQYEDSEELQQQEESCCQSHERISASIYPNDNLMLPTRYLRLKCNDHQQYPLMPY